MLITKVMRSHVFAFSQTKSWELKLHKPHLKKYFDNDSAKIEKEIKDISRKYSLQKKGIEKLFELKPQVFIPDSQQRKQVEDKIMFLNKMEEKEPIAGILNDLLFDSRHLLVDMDIEGIKGFIEHVKQVGFDETSASKVFGMNNGLIHANFDLVYQEKLGIMRDYLQMTDQEALQLFVHEPFLLTCSAERLRQSIVYFTEMEKQILTRQQVMTLLRDLGEVFLIGRQSLVLLLKWLKNWGIPRRQLWKILMQNPLILLNHPWQIFNYKLKMFRQFTFTSSMAKTLLKKHPSALICSVRALQGKFLVARDRLKIELTESNIEFLTFKFNANIRPRAEMLIRAKVPYTSQEIVDYFKCSDKEFVRKTGVPLEKLLEEKMRYEITAELDYPHKKCLRFYPSQKKIFEMSKKYYPEADLITSKKGKQ